MTTVQEHYDRHLGPVYTWMAGGFESALARGAAELDAIGVPPRGEGVAVDLGAGFGMHAVELARRGYRVIAVDTCAALLDQLRARAAGLSVDIVHDDLVAFARHLPGKADLVLCMGDTLTHLPGEASVESLVGAAAESLAPGARFVVSFRDYSAALAGVHRFIPVRSDEQRILTCFLEYGETRVTVHDILHERDGSQWKLSVGSYEKLRLAPERLAALIEARGLAVVQEAGMSGMVRFIATRT